MFTASFLKLLFVRFVLVRGSHLAGTTGRPIHETALNNTKAGTGRDRLAILALLPARILINFYRKVAERMMRRIQLH